jgi:magnesium-transporting ATPase (P-type)
MVFSLGFKENIIHENQREEEIPFDSERKLMTTINKVRR